MDATKGLARLLNQLGEQVMDDLDEHYTLVYVDRGDELPESAARGIIRGDDSGWEDLWDATGEWESDQRYRNSTEYAETAAKEVLTHWLNGDVISHEQWELLLDEWPTSDQCDAVRDAIMERDDSDWVKQLVGNYGDVLLRIDLGHEEPSDAADPVQMLKDIGLPTTDGNVALAHSLIANTPSDYYMVYAVASVDLDDVYELGWDCERVGITNPHLLMGNPYSGAYHDEGPFEGTIAINRKDLREDEDAGGYSMNNCYGGVHKPALAAEISRLPSQAEIDAAIESIKDEHTTTEEVAA